MNNNHALQTGTRRSAFANVTEAFVNGRMSVSENSLKNLKQYSAIDLKKAQNPSKLLVKKRILNEPLKEKENNNHNSDKTGSTVTQNSREELDSYDTAGNDEFDILSSTKKTSLSAIYDGNTDKDERAVHKRPISTLISHSDLKKIKFEKQEIEEKETTTSADDIPNKDHSERNCDSSKKETENSGKDEVLPVNHYENMITIPGKTSDNVYYRFEDLDLEDSDDVLMVSEYVSDIFSYFYKSELLCLANAELMLKHPNINQNRDILVNWLVKIHNQFNLLPETLYLAVNIMDRFLCKELVSLDKLQLVGTAALFIASKYEEVYSPSCKNFASVTDGACSEEDIKQGEVFILQTLDFKLDYPNPLNFLRRISKADEYHMDCRTVAKYLLEITIVDFRFIGIPPSKCAAAAFFLAKKMMGRPYWDGNFIHYSGGYSKKQLEVCVKMMMEYLEQPVIHEEFYKKYSTRRFCKASVASRDWAKRVIEQGFDVMDLHEHVS